MKGIQDAVKKLAERRDLVFEEAQAAMDDIMAGKASDGMLAAFLMGLRLKGETAEEIAGCAQSMRENAEPFQTRHHDAIDTCGTGGDGSGTFNVSTTAAIIVSASGIPVAKHGNRAVSSSCGSADVLRELGVKVELEPGPAGKVLDEVGISFLFAPSFHKAMKHAAGVRKEIGTRTVFNLLGPLTNPAGVRRQVVGVFARHMTETMAAVLSRLGSEHSLVVHGDGGIDEFSPLGSSFVSETRKGTLSSFTFDAAEAGVDTVRREDLLGGGAEYNAGMTRAILDGVDGAPRTMALLNAGAGIYVAGKARSIREGVGIAAKAIDSGAAKRKLQEWIEASQSY